jgi:hypothetical protein
MKSSVRTTIALTVVALVCAAAVLSADILVLRDGRRIEGQLISVQRGIIEFREDRGRDSRTIQVRRDEVQRIELEAPRTFDDRRPDRPPGPEGRGRPNGLRERDVWTDAKTPWTDSGLDVREGQVLYFDTHGGDIQWRRGAHARAGGDPDGPYSPRRPVPGRPVGALIAKVGNNSNDYFFIGDQDGPVRVRASGRLFLGINDENLSDNQGAFRVTVYY